MNATLRRHMHVERADGSRTIIPAGATVDVPNRRGGTSTAAITYRGRRYFANRQTIDLAIAQGGC